LTKVLYDALPLERQASMLVNKKVSDISSTADGVVVSCADGTSYEGSIIIGADGAHSLIRERMRTLALQASPPAPMSEVNEEKPFLTTYRALWVRFPTQSGLQPGDANETHGYGAAIQLFAGDETTVIGIYERMETPTRERARYTQADEEAFVDRWGHLPISKNMTVRDSYVGRVQAGMVSLEEGVVKHWSWDRIVLVGDAAHKFTPSTGAGCNNGIVDVVTLVNKLHSVVENAHAFGTDLAPSKDQIAFAFKEYQDSRYETVVAGCENAGQATAAATWWNKTYRFVDRHVLGSHTLQKYFAGQTASSIARSPVLDFIEGEERMNGKVPWSQPIQPRPLQVF
jgi:2-polyprenyl-6-methoxyphenol hydroxylase-like FAD-dependent oxidoreductase